MRYLFLPFLAVFTVVIFLIFPTSKSFGRITFKDVMSKQEQQKTGISELNYCQKSALECWINENFEPKQSLLERKKEPIYLTLNIEDGAKLEFSDGATYEIYPEDRIYTSYWITPFQVEFGESDHPDYPIKITNMQTGTEVFAKEITQKEFLESKQPPVPSAPQKPVTPKPLLPSPEKKEMPLRKKQPSSSNKPLQQEFSK